MRHAFLLVIAVTLARGVIIDQLAVTVGNQAITERQISEDMRLAALLNGAEVDKSVDARRAAAARLIEQALIRREMSFGSYPPISPSDVDQALADAEKRGAGPSGIEEKLRRYHLTRKDLREYLAWQLELLRFIDLRFRPAVQVTNEDIEKYYQENLVSKQSAGKAPDLSVVRNQIEQTLSGERVDEQLDRWIRQSRARSVVRFEDATLAPR